MKLPGMLRIRFGLVPLVLATALGASILAIRQQNENLVELRSSLQAERVQTKFLKSLLPNRFSEFTEVNPGIKAFGPAEQYAIEVIEPASKLRLLAYIWESDEKPVAIAGADWMEIATRSKGKEEISLQMPECFRIVVERTDTWALCVTIGSYSGNDTVYFSTGVVEVQKTLTGEGRVRVEDQVMELFRIIERSKEGKGRIISYLLWNDTKESKTSSSCQFHSY